MDLLTTHINWNESTTLPALQFWWSIEIVSEGALSTKVTGRGRQAHDEMSSNDKGHTRAPKALQPLEMSFLRDHAN